MLKNFKITNFSSFRETQELSLVSEKGSGKHVYNNGDYKLLKSLAIFGPNASGKSTLLKGFLFFRELVSNSFVLANNSKFSQFIHLSQFKFDDYSFKDPTVFEIEFFIKKILYRYSFQIKDNQIKRELLTRKVKKMTPCFSRVGSKISINNEFLKEDKIQDISDTGWVRDNVLVLSIMSNLNGAISKSIVSYIQSIEVVLGGSAFTPWNLRTDYVFDKLKDVIVQEKVSQMVKEADLSLTRISQEESKTSKTETLMKYPQLLGTPFANQIEETTEFKLLGWHKKYNKDGKEIGEIDLDFDLESDGTRAMIFQAPLFIDVLENGKTILVDELDSSLHPFLCRYFTKIFNSDDKNPKGAQLIFTTHDVSLLDKNILQRDQIWFTEKNKYGATELYSLKNLGERDEASYMKRYLEGRYGAVPYIKYLEDNYYEVD